YGAPDLPDRSAIRIRRCAAPRVPKWHDLHLSRPVRRRRLVLMMAAELTGNRPLDVARSHPLVVAWSTLALAAAVLRLSVIDRAPLNEAESGYAVAAWQAVLGRLDGSLVDGGAPLLSHALTLVFGLFGASDVAARVIAALAGVGLVLT